MGRVEVRQWYHRHGRVARPRHWRRPQSARFGRLVRPFRVKRGRPRPP